jgi:hypothetical protein
MIRRLDRSEDFRTTMRRLRREWEPWSGAFRDEPMGDKPRDTDTDSDTETEEEITFWVSVPSRREEPKGVVRRVARWLFVNGGMSVVLIVGLMLFPLLAFALGFR